ncbi:hypothetical protein C7M84_013748 [Penaeus vannamei]|uniref:Uncharacterized protein n=1 Tax=Penaeus vannamei TaxID=6689 RepID=A0A3R7M0A9_PENVA|nr:hypothetical protein C7M84_013748 [Penaeus vannamei]
MSNPFLNTVGEEEARALALHPRRKPVSTRDNNNRYGDARPSEKRVGLRMAGIFSSRILGFRPRRGMPLTPRHAQCKPGNANGRRVNSVSAALPVHKQVIYWAATRSLSLSGDYRYLPPSVPTSGCLTPPPPRLTSPPRALGGERSGEGRGQVGEGLLLGWGEGWRIHALSHSLRPSASSFLLLPHFLLFLSRCLSISHLLSPSSFFLLPPAFPSPIFSLPLPSYSFLLPFHFPSSLSLFLLSPSSCLSISHLLSPSHSSSLLPFLLPSSLSLSLRLPLFSFLMPLHLPSSLSLSLFLPPPFPSLSLFLLLPPIFPSPIFSLPLPPSLSISHLLSPYPSSSLLLLPFHLLSPSSSSILLSSHLPSSLSLFPPPFHLSSSFSSLFLPLLLLPFHLISPCSSSILLSSHLLTPYLSSPSSSSYLSHSHLLSPPPLPSTPLS